jgi:hypothetical protein
MQIAKNKSTSSCNQTGFRSILPKTWESLHIRVTVINLLFPTAFFIQMPFLIADTKPPILIYSEFTQPDKLQLRFWPMGKYAASTFTSHIRIPFNYSGLLNLQTKMNEHLDNVLTTLYEYGFRINNWDKAMLNSTFQLYKQNTDEIFKLFNNLLISLLHVPSRQHRQWDIASFVTATLVLTLAMYNTVQISKLEASIEDQKKKMGLLTDITKLHKEHLHKLDKMIQQIGEELQVIQMQQKFKFRMDRIIAQNNSDENKLRAVVATFECIIVTAFDQKLEPGALSTDVLNTIVQHIKNVASNN